jgi:hypothetical protein
MAYLNLGVFCQRLVNLLLHDRPDAIHTIEEDLLNLVADGKLVNETFNRGNTAMQPGTYAGTFKVPRLKPFAGSGRRPGTSNSFVPFAE